MWTGGVRKNVNVDSALDRLFFWNAVDLARKLRGFRDYSTPVAFVARSPDARRRSAPAYCAPIPPQWTATAGSRAAGVLVFRIPIAA
jgi:hypothetical protein